MACRYCETFLFQSVEKFSAGPVRLRLIQLKSEMPVILSNLSRVNGHVPKNHGSLSTGINKETHVTRSMSWSRYGSHFAGQSLFPS